MAGNPILSNGSLHAKINQLELVIKHLAAAHQADLMKLHQAMEACRNWQVSFITLNEQFDRVNVNLADAEARIRNAEENARQSANEAQRLMAVLNHIVSLASWAAGPYLHRIGAF